MVTRAQAVAEINVTPLIDVMLVLLIIFMVVTPLANRGLDVALPEPGKDADAGPPVPLVLGLNDSGLTLNRTPVPTLEDLEGRLRELFQARFDRTVFVRAAGTVPYGRVVEAMDVARGAGAARLGLLSLHSDP